ncbi:MAG: DUF4136 domain-containing protein, partial [Tannerella sp.]|nr:DUF4136 domain-containing protein [Tannerella sp.]
MKHTFFLLLFCCSISAVLSQTCRYGFSYEISNSPHWGKDKIVITSVYSKSPAERAGIKPFDIIEAIEGVPVTDSILDDIEPFLNPKGKEIVELTIKNFTSDDKKVKIKKECHETYGISEEQLASAFAMYAVEDNQERFFTCPYVTNNTQDPVDFSVFKSFTFFGDIDNQPLLAKKIMEYIRKELIAKGLKYDENNPDLMVQFSYSFNKNPHYKPSPSRVAPKEDADKSYAYRYDHTKDKISEFPFLAPGTIEAEAAYTLKLGLKLEDKKNKPGQIIWESEATELLNETYSIQEFAAVNIPLMCMQFPYTKYGRNVQFRLSRKKFNYTGINYNIDNIAEVVSVDAYSPAAKAGIIPHDKIEEINDKALDKTAQQFSAQYRAFIKRTMKLRDPKTQFTDANGFTNCMNWDIFKYPKVTNEFDKKKNLTIFSYLFSYEPFINPTGNENCTVKLRRDKE